jgi:hypothetical protein
MTLHNHITTAIYMNQPPKHASATETTGILSRTLNAKVALKDATLASFRESAHLQFMPAVQRALRDDNDQTQFTSAATNLATGGWILTELALRIADLSKSKGME